MTTPTQGTLDLGASREARDQGIAKVEMGADASWLDQAEAAIRTIARERAEFTSDDVWRRVGKPPEPRALGAVFNHLAKAGVIRRTGRYQATAQVSRHSAPIAIWQSLTFGHALSDGEAKALRDETGVP